MIDHTHDAGAQCWVETADDHADFPVQNLPLGVFSLPGAVRHIGTIIGDWVLDLHALSSTDALPLSVRAALQRQSLNDLFGHPPADRMALRHALFALLTSADGRSTVQAHLYPASEVTLHLPFEVGGYTDFYVGIHHAPTSASYFVPTTRCCPITNTSASAIRAEPVRRGCRALPCAAPSRVAVEDVHEVCDYLDAIKFARSQIKVSLGLPISIRLLNEHCLEGPDEGLEVENAYGGCRPTLQIQLARILIGMRSFVNGLTSQWANGLLLVHGNQRARGCHFDLVVRSRRMKILRTLLSWLGLTASAAAPFPSRAMPEPVLAATPDTPVNFGYKVNWFAVKTDKSSFVAQTLHLTNQRQANWKTGIEAAYARAEAGEYHMLVFVSPPVGGWVFVVGSNLPLPDLSNSNPQQGARLDRFEQLFGALSKVFTEVQFFASYRVVGLAGWARAREGRVERNFLFVDGEVYANVGAQTVEEQQLKFLSLSGLSPTRAREAIFANAEQRDAQEEQMIANGIDPQEVRRQLQQMQRSPIPDEEDAMAIAGAWSINPSLLEDQILPPSVGLVGRLP